MIKEKNMTAEQFAYWMQGFIEIQNPKTLTEEQLQVVKDHLRLVFKKVTPDYSITTTPNLCEGSTCNCNSAVIC